jgi:hypothetical protein
MRTSLGDQGSQVRVLSPRFASHCSAVKLFSLSCSRFQFAGISHFAGTSPHSLVDVLSCKTTLFRTTVGSRARLLDDPGRAGNCQTCRGRSLHCRNGRARLRCLKLVGQMLESGTLRAPGECSRSRNIPPQHIGGWFGRERLNLSATGEEVVPAV